jgi:hypothetical protein
VDEGVVLGCFDIVQHRSIQNCALQFDVLFASDFSFGIDAQKFFRRKQSGSLDKKSSCYRWRFAWFIGQNIVLLKHFAAEDAFALGNMSAEVDWTNAHTLVGFFLVLGVFLFPFVLKKRGILRGAIQLFLATAIFLQLVLVFYVGNIEAYSQRAALEFYESKKNENCYINTFGFKSYAHLFYSRMRSPTHKKASDGEWLLRGPDVDKPTYFVGKIDSKNELDGIETLQFLYEKNGFVFYKRKK